MKTLLMISAAAALSAPACASVSVSSEDFGLNDVPSGGALINFDDPTPAGFTIIGGSIRNVNDGYGAEPASSDGVKETSFYLAANPGDDATIRSVLGYKSVSFYWGSIDSYNTVSLLAKDGSVIQSFSGNEVHLPANGDQYTASTNRMVTFSTSGSTSPIYGVKFSSSQPAFEVDNVSFSSAVPEPASWAMMIGGIGLAGGMLRRRYRKSEQAFTAKVRSIAYHA